MVGNVLRCHVHVFTLAEQTTVAVSALRADPLMALSRVESFEGGLAAAIDHYAKNTSPDVIVVEDDGAAEALSQRLEALAAVVEPGRKVIVVGAVNDIGVYRRLIGLGVSDYLLSPADSESLRGSIQKAMQDPNAAHHARLVAFIGARGGVGSSTLAHNVAWAHAEATGRRTILADLDLAFGTAALAFNLDPRQAIAEVLVDPERLDAQLLERYISGESGALQILSTPGGLQHRVVPTVESIERLIGLARVSADLVIADLPHAWSDWAEDLLVAADDVIVTLVPDLANLRDARHIVETLTARRGESRKPKVIVNKSDFSKRSKLGVAEITSALQTQPIAAIPMDQKLFTDAMNDGKMLEQVAKSHKIAQQIRQLAAMFGAFERRRGGQRPLEKKRLSFFRRGPKKAG